VRSTARSPEAVRWVRRYSTLGEHAALWHALSLAGLAVGGRRWRARFRRAAATVLVAQVASSSIKLLVGRRRPAVESLPALMATPTGLSFPSSHASSSFAAARALSPLLGAVPLYTAAVAMALSRVYLGVHYPSDIAAGAVLGTVVGSAGRTRP